MWLETICLETLCLETTRSDHGGAATAWPSIERSGIGVLKSARPWAKTRVQDAPVARWIDDQRPWAARFATKVKERVAK